MELIAGFLLIGGGIPYAIFMHIDGYEEVGPVLSFVMIAMGFIILALGAK